MTDPPVRSDGICARPGCEKRRKPPASTAFTRQAGLEQYEAEPFCSRPCLEEYYDIEVHTARAVGNRGGGRRKVYAT